MVFKHTDSFIMAMCQSWSTFFVFNQIPILNIVTGKNERDNAKLEREWKTEEKEKKRNIEAMNCCNHGIWHIKEQPETIVLLVSYINL